MPRPQLKKLKQSLVITLIVSALVISLDRSGLLQRNEWIIYDWLLSFHRQQSKAPDDIAVILIDDASLQAMDSVVGQWPWPRSIFAELLEFLQLGNPKSIIFDILFVEHQNRGNNDNRLIDATAANGNTIHAVQFVEDNVDEYNKQLTDRPLPLDFTQKFRFIDEMDGAESTVAHSTANGFNSYLIPINGLYQAAQGIGIVSIETDRDGVLRQTRLLHRYQDNQYPALSIAPLLSDKSAPLKLHNRKLILKNQTIPVTSDDNLYINMYAHFNTYSMSGLLASISQLQAGDVENLLIDPSEFTNKYIFIGASAIGLQDLKTTALGRKIPGVTVHASVLGNILSNDLLAPPSQLRTTLTIILLAFLTTLAILRLNRISLQLLVPPLVASIFVLLASWEFSRNNIIIVASPLLSIGLSWALAFTYILFTEEKEKNKIRQMFSQYVSPAALSVMVDHYEDYLAAGAGSKENVSVLFSDIRGFTVLSEKLSAERVVELLNHYFGVMTQAIHLHHGTIDKFIGDAIMAIWGAPIKNPQHPQLAVQAALEMVRKMYEVNVWLKQKGFEPVKMGIGINTGEVILGSIGSEQKADYTVIGDNVNLASRLEGITKTYGCPIILSESTYRELDEQFPCRIVDRVRVKGKQKPITIYTPLIYDAQSGADAEQKAMQIAEQTAEAFSQYVNQQWDRSIALFEALPQDQLTVLYRQRCHHYRIHPPPDDWDGALTMTSK